LRPRTPLPEIRVDYCRFANANSFIGSGRRDEGANHRRVGRCRLGAEALAFILIGKLFRKAVAPARRAMPALAESRR
jgi:hypothetical protein